MNFSSFLLFLNKIKALHWSATKHSQHVILDDIHKKFSEKIDEFVESCIGVNDVQTYDSIKIIFDIPEDEDDIVLTFERMFDDLSTALGKYANRPELESLVDDFNNLANKYIYLLRMTR